MWSLTGYGGAGEGEVRSMVRAQVLLFSKIGGIEGGSGLRKRKQKNFTLTMLPLRYRRELSGDGGETVESSGLGCRRSLTQQHHGIHVRGQA